jgi:UDP-glucose 4-epimerase
MKRVLITGSRGFLGGYLKSLLHAESVEVIELQRPNAERKGHNVFFSVSELVNVYSGFDVIFHLAAFIPYAAMNKEDEQLQRVNVELTRELLFAFPQVRFVFASSVAVYGACRDQPIVVDSLPIDANSYGFSKAAAEGLVRQMKSFAIVRFASIIGPGMKPVSMIPAMILQAKLSRKITVYGDGSRMQNYVDVRDAAVLLKLAAAATENILTLGVSTVEYSNLQVAKLIAHATGADVVLEGSDSTIGNRYDDRAMHEHLGFQPKFDLIDTIHDIIAL